MSQGTSPGLSQGQNRDKPGDVPRPTGHKSLCLCAFFLPEKGLFTGRISIRMMEKACPSCPWCFCFLGVFLAVKFLSFGVFSTYFPGFFRVRKVREILGAFEVFLGIFQKRPKKDGKGGLSFRGVAFMTVLAVLQSTIPFLCLCQFNKTAL